MSIYLHVGQCGNQLGKSMLELAKEPKASNRSEHMRCILVDTEPKVVRTIKATKNISAVHIEQSGRGNNWAMGYNKAKNTQLSDCVMESLRREIESTDCYRGAIVFHSLAGGTGSGLGCRLIEKIRERYPKSHLISGCIAPSLSGDTPLQNYNAILAMGHLQEYTDAVLYKDNDDIMRSISYWNNIKTKDQSASISLSDMNAYVAADWAGLLFPSTKGKIRRLFDIATFVADVCPISQAKFIDVRSAYYISNAKTVPFMQFSSASHQDHEVLGRSLVGSFPRASGLSIGQHLTLRKVNETTEIESILKHVTKHQPSVDWAAARPSLLHSSSPPFTKVLSSLTICSNGTNLLPTLQTFIDRAVRQLHARAYIHWYKKFGVEQVYIEDCLQKAESIVAEYSNLMTNS